MVRKMLVKNIQSLVYHESDAYEMFREKRMRDYNFKLYHNFIHMLLECQLAKNYNWYSSFTLMRMECFAKWNVSQNVSRLKVSISILAWVWCSWNVSRKVCGITMLTCIIISFICFLYVSQRTISIDTSASLQWYRNVLRNIKQVNNFNQYFSLSLMLLKKKSEMLAGW